MGTASNRTYVGHWNTTSGAYKNVVGTAGNTKGTYTCQSGASTGVNCDIKIINKRITATRSTTDGSGGVRAERQANVRTHGTGDSGGPVLKNTSRSSDVLAAGIISDGQDQLDGGGSAAPGTRCFKKVIYKHIQTVADNGTTITSWLE